MIDPKGQADFVEQGFVVARGLLLDQVEPLRAEAAAVVAGERGAFRGWLAGDGTLADRFRLHPSVHFPHKLSPTILKTFKAPALVDVLTSLIGPNVKGVQSALFLRTGAQPGRNWHQDEHYVPTRDRSLVGAWIALDPCDRDSGCLWVIPGSQRDGVLWAHTPHGQPDRFDPVASVQREFAGADPLPLEVAAGDVVFFSGYLLHRSLPYADPSRLRRALAFHYASAETLLPWMGATERAPAGSADLRDFVLVAGEDPRAELGLEDRLELWVFPPREL